MPEPVSSPVIVALDFPGEKETLALVEKLPPGSCRLKVGKELFTRAGPTLVRRLVDSGFDVFLDLKYHDIPHTVAQACKAAADLGVWMLNVHALGGRRMMQAAREALQGDDAPALIAVTWLTSSGQAELDDLGIAATPADMVRRLATMAQQEGLDGVVCSAQEAPMLRAQAGDGFLLVTPGIRPADSSRDDQQRVVTPAQAMADGASFLVIGRPITRSNDPCRTILTINSELSDLRGG